jgi:hypothetical protein
MLVRVARDADREVLDDLSGRGWDGRRRQDSGDQAHEARKRAYFALFAALVQMN